MTCSIISCVICTFLMGHSISSPICKKYLHQIHFSMHSIYHYHLYDTTRYQKLHTFRQFIPLLPKGMHSWKAYTTKKATAPLSQNNRFFTFYILIIINASCLHAPMYHTTQSYRFHLSSQCLRQISHIPISSNLNGGK